ncbi:MAG: sensor histidine kinase [Clostridia bacterium]|nr:sensor histidine kinase [Clostridia bacterium]
MKELSLNILDIAKNSVKAKAENILIKLDETDETLTLTIKDDGCGMSEETVQNVMNPFYTTRTTRNVGMGVPLLKLAAEQTGGSIEITSVCENDSPENHGTTVTAVFFKNHLDFTPLGDVISTVTVLIQGSPDIDWKFVHTLKGESVELDTKELREVLGDVPLDSYEVIKWIEDFLKEAYDSVS